MFEEENYYSQDLFGDDEIAAGEALRENEYDDYGVGPVISPASIGILAGSANQGPSATLEQRPTMFNGIPMNDSDFDLSPSFLKQFSESDTSVKLEMVSNLAMVNPEQFATDETAGSSNVAIAGGVGLFKNKVAPLNIVMPNEESIVLENWGGPFNFKVTPMADSEEKTTKRNSIYCPETNKLFCRDDGAIPFKFEMDLEEIQNTGERETMLVRAFLVYDDNDAVDKPVLRCLRHTDTERNVTDESQLDRLEHMMRPIGSANLIRDVSLWQNPNNKRCYLIMPLKSPEAGMRYSMRSFGFTCKNSCIVSEVEGKSRKAISIIFCLFNSSSGEVLGRSRTRVRVCSAPIRDYNKEVGTRTPVATNRKRRSEDAEADAGLPAAKQVNFGPGTTEMAQMNPRLQALRSVVRASVTGRAEDDGVSSSQETVYSGDESEHRIQLRDLLRDLRWVLKFKHSPNLSLRDCANNVFNTLKLTQDLCNSARRLDEQHRQQEEKSPDGGFHDSAQD